ncbi:hypothetical protein BDZ89DRAFT_300272 [Hymenopellis radicata]|nr:hypothetical protein BDZ89DRAFT_300272 [Hymenopellis radicata]
MVSFSPLSSILVRGSHHHFPRLMLPSSSLTNVASLFLWRRHGRLTRLITLQLRYSWQWDSLSLNSRQPWTRPLNAVSPPSASDFSRIIIKAQIYIGRQSTLATTAGTVLLSRYLAFSLCLAQ